MLNRLQAPFIVLSLYCLAADLFLNAWLPWWHYAIAALLVGGLLARGAGIAAGAGALAVGTAHLIEVVLHHTKGQGILTERMGKLFSLPNGLLLGVVAVLIGAAVAALSALAGYQLRAGTLGPLR